MESEPGRIGISIRAVRRKSEGENVWSLPDAHSKPSDAASKFSARHLPNTGWHGTDQPDTAEGAVLRSLNAGALDDKQTAGLKVKHGFLLGVAHQRFAAGA
jgi:hypothetical protein